MPTLPWTTSTERGHRHDGRAAVDHRSSRRTDVPAPVSAVVMTSRFRLRGFRHVLPFLIDAMRVRKQVLAADGALGVSLVAHPLRREFWTLSAWRDRTALDAMVRAEPHRSVMRRYHDRMVDSRFAFWDVPATELPVGWDEARHHLETASRGTY